MTNNERFNAMLNSCENPRAVYGALGSADECRLIGMIRESRDPARPWRWQLV